MPTRGMSCSGIREDPSDECADRSSAPFCPAAVVSIIASCGPLIAVDPRASCYSSVKSAVHFDPRPAVAGVRGDQALDRVERVVVVVLERVSGERPAVLVRAILPAAELATRIGAAPEYLELKV